MILLSDHGFCRLKREVYVNRFLEEWDWLSFAHRKPRKISDMLGHARAYSLMPGRIYMNVRGREPKGSIRGAYEYQGFREGLAADLLRLKDPETGEAVIADVLRGEEVSTNPAWGDFPVAVSEREPAPCDLLAVPAEGYDLKGSFDGPGIFGSGVVTGTHTPGEAFVYFRGRSLESGEGRVPHLLDLFPTILEIMGIPGYEDADGRPLFGEVL